MKPTGRGVPTTTTTVPQMTLTYKPTRIFTRTYVRIISLLHLIHIVTFISQPSTTKTNHIMNDITPLYSTCTSAFHIYIYIRTLHCIPSIPSSLPSLSLPSFTIISHPHLFPYLLSFSITSYIHLRLYTLFFNVFSSFLLSKIYS